MYCTPPVSLSGSVLWLRRTRRLLILFKYLTEEGHVTVNDLESPLTVPHSYYDGLSTAVSLIGSSRVHGAWFVGNAQSTTRPRDHVGEE